MAASVECISIGVFRMYTYPKNNLQYGLLSASFPAYPYRDTITMRHREHNYMICITVHNFDYG